MNRTSQQSSQPATPANGFDAGRWIRPLNRAESAWDDRPAQDRAFVALLNAYRPHAGLTRLHSLAAGARFGHEGRACAVQDLLDGGVLFGFHWADAVWIPMFQLDLKGSTVASAPQRVVAELGRGFDGWALASWFVQPNSCLAGASPIECLHTRLRDVLEAARTDRFVANG
jgi:hypothetical protein